MKVFRFLSAIGFLFLLFSCQEENNKSSKGTNMGSLDVSESMPMCGDSIRLTYHADNAFKNPDKFEATYIYFVGNKYYPNDIHLKKSDGKWTGSLVLPDSATALVYIFKSGEQFDDNGKKGYVQKLYNEKGEPVAGSLASLGYFYLTTGERFGIQKDKDSALALIKTDLESNSDLRDFWSYDYLRMTHDQNAEKGKKLIAEEIKTYEVKHTLNDGEYDKLMRYYSMLNNKTAEDSIKKIAIENFPRGEVASGEMVSKFFVEKDVDKQKTLFEDYKTIFGKDKGPISYMLTILANNYRLKGDLENFLHYTNQISDKSRQASLYNSAAWSLVEKDEKLDLAEEASKKSLDIITSLQEAQEEKPDYVSVKQYEDMLKGSYLMYVDTYALILFKQGKIKEALIYQKEALGDKRMGRPDVNERYVQFLVADKQWNEAQKEASRFIRTNNSTSKIKEYLKEAYVNKEGSPDGFTAYLEGLEKKANKEALTKIKSNMIDEEGHDFTLRNLEGEAVTLSRLKGKTVVLDFWATWCGPCKDSFPGMQMAVDKYKDDPDVVFLFIDTWENGESEKRKKAVGNFITQNKYTFNVLFDNPVKEGSRTFVTTDKYEINGIPTKIIIGPDGNIKFKAIGNIGSGEKLVRELDMMIGLLKS